MRVSPREELLCKAVSEMAGEADEQDFGPDRYLPFLPTILNWIQQTLDAHARERRVVSSFNFPRLPRYFSEKLLKTASVVPTDRLPVPPLSALGIREFADFENQPISGITYKETYFLERSAAATDESLHFHELVHIVQWQVLGPKDFLLLYAIGLSEHGYLRCPLEAMAFEHQRRFDAGEPPYSVEAEVHGETLLLMTQAGNWPTPSLGDSPGRPTTERLRITPRASTLKS